jgi:photosystem II stability/assembly factor-like uncharacterized protein
VLIFDSNAQNPANWEILNELGNLETVSFINENVGWIYGLNTFLKTDDGGRTWYSLSGNGALLSGNDSLNFKIEALDFVNETVGWAITYLYLYDTHITTIQKTEDGGNSWDVIDSPFNLSLMDECGYLISAIDDSTVYACRFDDYYDTRANPTRIIKTTDAGSSWQDISPPKRDREYNSAWFKDTQYGLYIGSILENDNGGIKHAGGIALKTENGGQSWREKEIPEFEEIYGLQFINDSTCFFLGQQPDTSSRYGNYALCKSKDTLNTWLKIYQDPSLYAIRSFFCLDEMTIWAIINDSTYNSILIKSTDGGVTWNNAEANGWETNGWNDKIYFAKADIGFIVSSFFGDILYQTFDGGENWAFQLFRSQWNNLNGVCFIDKSNGFAFEGGPGFHGSILGDLYVTEDGGKWWRQFPNRPGISIDKCQFIDQNAGFILSRDYENVYCCKSNDGGKNWPEVNKINIQDTSHYYFRAGTEMYFETAEDGWVSGRVTWSDDSSGAGIVSTHDGGKNWKLVWTYPNTNDFNYSFNSIYALNNFVWAVAEGGLIVRLTQTDSFTVINGNTDLPLNDVFFSDENHGWISGGYYNWQEEELHVIILKTSNGGESWKEFKFDKYMFYDMYFEDNLHGWAVGYERGSGGSIFETSDGGETWNPIVENLSAPINAIHFKDGYGWAVGDNGLILRTEDGSTWIDQNNGKIYVNQFNLSQNYPNPFNPRTTINYQIPLNTQVKLSIYNLLGQKVVTLVNKKQPAGRYTVEWDAGAFASGVYIYRFETNTGFMQSRKLILLK